MIERLCLPNPALSAQGLIYLVGGSALDCIHDFGKGAYSWRVWIHQRSEDDVNVIGHDHSCLKIKLGAFLVQAAIERDASDLGWQDPAMIGAEGQEVRLVVTLQMRQL